MDYTQAIADAMEAFSGYVWSTPMAILLTGVGLIFTLMTFGIQFKALTHGFAVISGKYDNPEDEGNISHFQALCAALSATIGLGNISGVAVAVATGGPGAVFWMWVVGFFGMATKFMTCSLATMYRKQDKFGEYRGGPMYYIELGLGGESKSAGMKTLAKVLAVLFAILGMSASVGAGNMFQANQVAQITVNLFKNTVEGGVSENTQFMIQMAVGLTICVMAALVMIGGIKRIGGVASKLVPTMCVIYVVGAFYVIISNFAEVPGVFASIFSDAFTGSAGQGAFYGIAVRQAVLLGVKRACFSNEAGLGSAPIAHATAKTNEPIREGVVAAVGPFIDTIVICTITALVILTTGAYARDSIGAVQAWGAVESKSDATATESYATVTLKLTDQDYNKVGERLLIKGHDGSNIEFDIQRVDSDATHVHIALGTSTEAESKLQSFKQDYPAGTEVFLFRDGVNLTAFAFDQGLAGFGTYFIPIAALLFAFSTIVSWGFYGETCTEYLFGEKAVLPFKVVFVSMILLGTASMELKPVLDWSDGMLGLMLVPNLIGTFLLAPKVLAATREYFARLNAGEFEEEARRAAEAKKHPADNI